jgi:hypothetical protein
LLASLPPVTETWGFQEPTTSVPDGFVQATETGPLKAETFFGGRDCDRTERLPRVRELR